MCAVLESQHCGSEPFSARRVATGRAAAKQPSSIVFVEEMVVLVLAVSPYFVGTSVEDIAIHKSGVFRSICNSLRIPTGSMQVLQWERPFCMLCAETLSLPNGTQLAFAISADACRWVGPLVRPQNMQGLPGGCAGHPFDQPPQEKSWPDRAPVLIAIVICRGPDLADVFNGAVPSACDLALSAFALTADGFGCGPSEVAAFIHHVGQRMRTCTSFGLAPVWAHHLAVAVPIWLQPPYLACGLDTHPKWCKDAFGVSRTITVQGLTRRQGRLACMKRIETRGFRLRLGWWNLHVGAQDAPEVGARVAGVTRTPCVDEGAPRSAILGRFSVVGVFPTSMVPDCRPVQDAIRYCNVIGQTIMLASPIPCMGAPWSLAGRPNPSCPNGRGNVTLQTYACEY
jgi:hypothetical protein